MSAMHKVLDRVTRVHGVRGVMVVAEADGLVVADALSEGIDGAPVAALAASLASRLRRAAAAIGGAAPSFIQLRAERGALLAVPAKDDLLLVAIADKDANLGLARLELRAAAERVR